MASFLDEVVDELEKKYKSPSPDSLSLTAATFERFAHRNVLSALGLVLFVGGLLSLLGNGSLAHHRAVWLALVPGVMLVGLSVRHKLSWLGAPSVFAGAGLGLILLAILHLTGGVVSATLVVCFSWLAAALVFAGRLPAGALLFYAALVPVALLSLRSSDVLGRLVVEGLTLLPPLLAFIFFKRKAAACGILAGVVIAATLEMSKQSTPHVALSVLLVSFLVAVVIYEARMPGGKVSDLRSFIGQSVPVLLILLTVKSAPETVAVWSPHMGDWLFAALLASAYQLVLIAKEKFAYPTRLGWIAIAIAVAVFLEWEDLGWQARVCVLVAGAAILQAGGLYARRPFLSNLAIGFATAACLYSVEPIAARFDLGGYLACLLAAAAALLLGNRPALEAELPWWAGFIRPDHARIARRAFLVCMGLLLKLPFVATIFFWIRTTIIWLRYFRSGEQPIGVTELVFAASQVYAAWVTTTQAALYFASAGAPPDAIARITLGIWAAWGLALVLVGTWRGEIFYRVLGVGFVLAPAAFQLVGGEVPRGGGAWLALIAGAVLSVCTYVVGRFAVSDNGGGPDQQPRPREMDPTASPVST